MSPEEHADKLMREHIQPWLAGAPHSRPTNIREVLTRAFEEAMAEGSSGRGDQGPTLTTSLAQRDARWQAAVGMTLEEAEAATPAKSDE